jgi:hypothetical protein
MATAQIGSSLILLGTEMSIDNQLKVRQQQIEAKKREQSVPPVIAKTAIAFTEFALRLLKAKAELQPLDALSAFGKMFNDLRAQWAQSNTEYLLEGVVEEIERLTRLYESMAEQSRNFLDYDWPLLVLKAMEDGRSARDRRRLDRVVSILTHAAFVADPLSGDRTEQLIRIALELGEAELAVMKIIYETQNGALERIALSNDRPLLRPGEIDDAWEKLQKSLSSEQKIELPSLCRTLEGYGLVASIGGGVSSLAAYGPWSLLLRGKQLVEHIRTELICRDSRRATPPASNSTRLRPRRS